MTLGAHYRPKMSDAGDVSVRRFISAADGGDISFAVQRAVAYADSKGGGVVRIPPGLYTGASYFDLGGYNNVVIDATGASVTMEAATTFFRVAPPVWEEVQAAAAVDGDDFWGPRKTVTVTDGSAFAVNDLVKLCADDKQRCTRAAGADGTDYRRGWMAVVEAVAGNVLTLDRPCPWDMDTNVRIARMPRRRIEWRGGMIGYELGHEADWRPTPMIANGVSDLLIDGVDIEHTYNAAISLVGCFGARVRASGRDLRNMETNEQFGYLLNDGSYFTRAELNGGRNRHCYTTNMPRIAADSAQIELYGATYGALVTGQCHGNSQAAWDTHHGAENVTFANCVASGGTTGGGQFVVRGVAHRLINPQAYNGKNGILIYTEEEKGVTEPTNGIIVQGADVDVDQYPLYTLGETDFEVRGGCFRSRKSGNIGNLKGKVRLRGDVTFRPGVGSNVNGARAIRLDDAIVDARHSRVIFDLQDIPVGASQYGAITGLGAAASAWNGGEVVTTNDANMTAVFYKEAAATGTVIMKPEKIVTQKLGANYKINCQITGSTGVGFAAPWDWRADDWSWHSGYIEVTVTADYLIPLLRRGNREVIVRAYVNGGASKTLGALPLGTYVGQVLTISAVVDSGLTLTVPNGAAFNTALGGSDVVLSGEQALRLMWHGTRWTRAA
ncbi:hypothetical protein [Xinfangfangia pollutisoli]|uniref:hypothetical protein n=1 Tax=Xinfangfangia pollutisoli TaxID=2865960 RepID=UPI001CD4B519|nr:hypothetical protein [Xinfangfangia pollutisoli]